jgi:hypothetical protein
MIMIVTAWSHGVGGNGVNNLVMDEREELRS